MFPFTWLDIIFRARAGKRTFSLKKAAASGEKILCTTWAEDDKGLQFLGELFNRRIMPGRFPGSAGMEKAIIGAKNEDCRVVMGAGVAMKLARRRGLIGAEFPLTGSEQTIDLKFRETISKKRPFFLYKLNDNNSGTRLNPAKFI